MFFFQRTQQYNAPFSVLKYIKGYMPHRAHRGCINFFAFPIVTQISTLWSCLTISSKNKALKNIQNQFYMKLKKKFLTMQIVLIQYGLLTRTNNLNFDIDMVRSGEQFYIPMIILQFLFNFKQTKLWSVNVEAVTEAVSVFVKFLVHKLTYRCKWD